MNLRENLQFCFNISFMKFSSQRTIRVHFVHKFNSVASKNLNIIYHYEERTCKTTKMEKCIPEME